MKIHDAQGNYLHDAEPMLAPPADPPTIEAKVDAVVAAVAALVDDRHADAVDALATVTNEGASP